MVSGAVGSRGGVWRISSEHSVSWKRLWSELLA
jgi:hypothetical protein